MRSTVLPLLGLVALLLAAPVNATNYGAPMPEGEALPVAEALAQGSRLEGQPLKLSGRITEVCQNTGCWVALDAAGTPVRVRTQHAFFVPKDSSGQAVVHGTWQAVPPPAEAPATGLPPPRWQVIATSITILP